MSLEDITVTDLSQAKQELTANDASLDAMADLVLRRVGKFFGECVSEDSFCAIAVDEKRSQKGQLISLTLIPCDEIDGSPVRRVAREVSDIVGVPV